MGASGEHAESGSLVLIAVYGGGHVRGPNHLSVQRPEEDKIICVDYLSLKL